MNPLTGDDFSKIPVHRLTASLASTVCPSCGKHKQQGHTLCRPCYGQLARPIALALYRTLGAGYEQAFAAALNALMVSIVYLPGSVQRIAPAAYVDRAGTLHIEVQEMLDVLGVADTPANRDDAARLVADVVNRLCPGTKITEV